MSQSTTDQITLVTGASRGVGLGIAEELGAAGATVYVTGRSRAGDTTDGLPGTVEGAAQVVTDVGGDGIAVVCDHTMHTDVQAIVRRIRKEQGRLDLLVNSVWGGYEAYDDELFRLPVWEQPIWRWDDQQRTTTHEQPTTTVLLGGERGRVWRRGGEVRRVTTGPRRWWRKRWRCRPSSRRCCTRGSGNRTWCWR